MYLFKIDVHPINSITRSQVITIKSFFQLVNANAMAANKQTWKKFVTAYNDSANNNIIIDKIYNKYLIVD